MKVINNILDFFNHKFTIGDSISFSPRSILIVTLVFIITSLLLKLLKKIIYRTLSNDAKIKFRSIFSFINYFIYIVVILFTFQNIGINVTAIFAASAALLVGVGLALQTFIQDIISGMFILVDQSVHVGDIIEVEGQVGKVENIKLRTTRAVTRENKVLIIPNHKFLISTLFNWTENGVITKESVAVGVSYNTDIDQVTQILLDLAGQNKKILENPKPFVIFEDFGDNALNFQLFFALKSSFESNIVKSDLRYSIFRAFKKEKIEIPFPQRTISFLNPPKSLGVEWVNKFVLPLFDKFSDIPVKDLLHTFSNHIAKQISANIESNTNVLITGGGAYNDYLIQRIRDQSNCKIHIPDPRIIEYKEAVIFAFLGVLRNLNINNCYSSVTGAKKDHCSGKIIFPRI